MSPQNFEIEYNTILTIAKNNGFPYNLIHELYINKLKSYYTLQHTSLQPIVPDSPRFSSIPFINPISLKIRSTLEEFNFNIVFKSPKTLKSSFSFKLDSIKPLDKSGIYLLRCSCNDFYIGRTFRSFKTRIGEHSKEISNPDSKTKDDFKSNFAKHVLNQNHHFNSDPTLLYFSSNNNVTDLVEQILITQASSSVPSSIINEITTFPNLNITPFIQSSYFEDILISSSPPQSQLD